MILYITQQDYTQGRVRNFLAAIKRHQKYNPTLKAIKDKHNIILSDLQITRQYQPGKIRERNMKLRIHH